VSGPVPDEAPWVVKVAEAALSDDELDPTDVLAGEPVTRSLSVWEAAGIDAASLGIWEITPGTVTDVEADELFVVLTGSATIACEDGPTLEVGPGDVCRLRAGQRTVWTVHETLRKVYAIVSG
jgi:uncharacterized cupin superfamily protein